MRAFVVLCFVAWAAADVSELSEAGYNYHQPSGSGFLSGGSGDFGAASNLDSGFSAGGPGGLDFGVGGAAGLDAAPTVSKRFFTYTAQDSGDDDDDSDAASGGVHKNYDVVFAKAPAPSLKSVLRAVQRYAGEQNTAVYVLSKTLGAAELGNALRASGIKPNKPEVHFVKYRTREEAAHAQQQVRAQYDALGGHTENGGEETAPVRSVVGSLGYRNRGYNGRGSHNGHGSHSGHHGHSGHGHGGNFGLGSGLSSQYLPPSRYLPPRY